MRPPRASLRGCLPSLRVALALGRICTLLGAVRPVGPGGVLGGHRISDFGGGVGPGGSVVVIGTLMSD